MSRTGLFAVLVGVGLTWGLSIPVSKVAMSTGHQPLGVIFWQLVIVAIVLGAVTFARGTRPRVDHSSLTFFLTVGLLGTLIPNSFSYLALTQLPAGVIAIVIASVPMFALIIALGIGLEAFSLRRSLGVLLGIAAMFLLIAPKTSLPDPGKVAFVWLALIAPLCYGAEGNYIAKQAPRGDDPITTLLGAAIIAACIAAPMAVLSGSWVNLAITWSAAEWALLGAGLLHVFAYTGYVWLVGAAGPVFASQVSYVVTTSGVVFGALLLGERHSLWVTGALVVMVLGLSLVQPRRTSP